jgi:hypothetical protein
MSSPLPAPPTFTCPPPTEIHSKSPGACDFRTSLAHPGTVAGWALPQAGRSFLIGSARSGLFTPLSFDHGSRQIIGLLLLGPVTRSRFSFFFFFFLIYFVLPYFDFLVTNPPPPDTHTHTHWEPILTTWLVYYYLTSPIRLFPYKSAQVPCQF